MKSQILLLIISLLLFNSSCENQITDITEPIPVPLTTCGPLEYMHSMFVINNECWGENQPQDALLNPIILFTGVSFRGKYRNYDRFLGVRVNQNYTDKKHFIILYAISMGDGLIESYSNLFHIDSVQTIQLKFNQDSTELNGVIKDLNLKKDGKTQLPYIPDKVVINEGSFRVRLVR